MYICRYNVHVCDFDRTHSCVCRDSMYDMTHSYA